MRFIISLFALSVAARAAVIVPLELRAEISCSTDVRHTINWLNMELKHAIGWRWSLRAG
jgi:hypothetical protein